MRPSRLRSLVLVGAVFLGLAVSAPVAVQPVAAQEGTGSPTDPNVKFFGRWDTSDSTAYASKWAGAYVEVGFTGTTVKLQQRGTIDFWASIDGGDDIAYTNVSGTVDLTPTPLPNGEHVLRVSYRPVAGSYTGDAVYQRIELDAGARTFEPPVDSQLIEFVGDSITVGQLSSKQSLTSYAWLTGEQLGTEHTQIAEGGACLVEAADGCRGMSERFLNTSSDDDSPGWDFSTYTADAVVINLGTNDIGHSVSGEEFQAAYIALLQRAREKYPDAAIFAMETFRLRYVPETQAAVSEVNDAGDANVYFVNTEGWIDEASDTVDDVHPNDQGHQKIADQLAPIIAEHL